MNENILETSKLTIKLLDGKSISIRPLTLSERKECLEKFPVKLEDLSKIKETEFINKYLDFQVDLIHYIITRSVPNFTKKDVEEKLDTSLISQILTYTLKDPFSDLMNW